MHEPLARGNVAAFTVGQGLRRSTSERGQGHVIINKIKQAVNAIKFS